MNSASTSNLVNNDVAERKRHHFYHLCAVTAGLQGRISYLIMSIYTLRPISLNALTEQYISSILYANMVYGVAVMIYWRPSMVNLSLTHRVSFSVLGSLMFNYSSMAVYEWLKEHFGDKKPLLIFATIVSGRIMMLHLLAFLYHTDRNRGYRNRNYHEFESMYH